MIDRIFFGEYGQTPNPYGVKASEYDVTTNTFRNLSDGITSNSWCSAGGNINGQIVDLGGGGDWKYQPMPDGGGDSIRLLTSCQNCANQFVENRSDPALRLLAYRWYPTAIKTWDNRLLIVSGADLDGPDGYAHHGDTFEFWPRYYYDNNLNNTLLPINLDTSPQTCGPGNVCEPRPLYPHVHLLPNYEYFICSTNQWYTAWLYGAAWNFISKGPGYLDPYWADGGTPVTYPGSGTSFMLPLSPPYTSATVILCGATWGTNSIYTYVDPGCAVITPTDANPVSSRSTGLNMPDARIMPYCIILLDGNVACMMGAASGFAGYYSAINPLLRVNLLNTTSFPLRFTTGASATVPRLYHSCASLVASGAVITAGSNPQGQYAMQYEPSTGVYPSEFRVEYYYPWYFNVPRPVITTLTTQPIDGYSHGSTITVSAQLTALTNKQSVAIICPGFSTHNQQMSQRYVFLACTCPTPTAQAVGGGYVAVVACACTIPDSYAVAPADDYLLTLLDGGVPSQAQWITVANA